MAPECVLSCGNNKYYLHTMHGRYLVERQDWLERTFVGFAGTVAQAMSLIRADAKCEKIIALPAAIIEDELR